MFEFYNRVREIVFIFKGGRLIFANESALHFLNSYFHVLVGKPLDFFFQNTSFEGKVNLVFCNGATLTCECGYIVLENEEVLLIKQCTDSVETNEIKIQTPKVMYDPMALGKSAVLVQSITDPLHNIMEMTEHLMKSDDAHLKWKEELQEISRNAGEVYQKAKFMLEEYETLQLQQNRVVSCFDLKEAVQKSCRRIEQYIELERLPVKLTYSGRTQDCFVLADKEQLVKAFSGLIACLIRYLTDHELKGRVNVKTYATEQYAQIVIEDNIRTADNMFETFTYTDSFQLTPVPGQQLLPLQMINALIEGNFGNIFCLANPGVGMRYTIRFPLSDKRRFSEKEKEVDIAAIVLRELQFFLSI